MCGFLGELNTQLIEKESFEELLKLSSNRGPDQKGYWANDNCQLGFNRLSIIDVSENGKQPLLSPTGKFALLFNGEVYNYKEIQNKHNILDSDLRSKSDTEILAHLVEKVTIEDFAKELNGMFAISVYDIKHKKLHLIRDFAGVKPLFYGIHTNGIVFASQFDQIFKHPAFNNKKLRPDIMKEYLSLGYMQAPNTVFENIFQIMPSQIITWNQENKIVEKKTFFWNWQATTKFDETDKELVNKFENLFEKVIKRQLNSDVPIATFLSGGIDSPLVTAFAKLQKNDLKAFTVEVEDKELNESEVAKKIAAKLNVEQSVEVIDDQQLLSILDSHFEALKEPFGDFSSLPTYLITSKAKKHATVMLSGDGGDELFWGYPRFIKSAEQSKWFKIPLWIRKIIIPFIRKYNPKISSSIDVIDTFGEWILEKQVHLKTNLLMPNVSFSKDLIELYQFKKPINKTNILLYLKQNEFEAHLQKVLKKVDLTSMGNSIEVRVPFLDKETIVFSNQINPQLSIKHFNTKFLLKKVLSERVGEDIVNLPKKGFSVPLEKWLRNQLADDVKETLLNKTFYGEEFINKQELEKMVSCFYQNKRGMNSWGIWHLYAWQKWAEKHVK